jgi:hypothetical protein
MACSLTQGFTPKTCKTPAGTIALLIAEYDNVSTITKTAGVVTAISMASGKQFFQYKQKAGVANWKETGTATAKEGAYQYESTVTFDINSIDSASKIEADLLLKNTVMVIAKENDGTYWLLGQDYGLDVTSLGYDGGTDLSTFRGAKVELKGMGYNPVAKVDSSIITALLSPASP